LFDPFIAHADQHGHVFATQERAMTAELRHAEVGIQKLMDEFVATSAAQDHKNQFHRYTCSKCSTSSTKTVAPPTSTSTNAPIIAADSTMFGPAGMRRVRRSQVVFRISITERT